MSKRPRNFDKQPLKNITIPFNNKMSYTSDSGFSNLANSPMSNLAFDLSELSTGRRSPRLRRKLSLSSVDTPPNGCTKTGTEDSMSAESGCFSGSPLADSPTFESLSVKRYTSEFHPEIPPEAFSTKKKTIAFRRFNSQPLPTLRLDSPTDFLEEDKDENDNRNRDAVGFSMQRFDSGTEDHHTTSEHDTFPRFSRSGSLLSDDACSQDSGLGFEHDRVSSWTERGSVSSFDDASSTCSSLCQLDRLPSLEDVWNSMDSPNFKAPRGKPPKRSRSLMEDETCSPLKYSPVKSSSSLPRPSFSKALFTQIPEVPNETIDENKPLTSDGFQELFSVDDLKNEADGHVSSLISGPLLHRPSEDNIDEAAPEEHPDIIKKVKFSLSGDTPSSRPTIARRGLQRSQSLDIRPRPISKRCEPPIDGTTPIQTKRWRGNEYTAPSSKDEDDIIIDDAKDEMLRAHRRLHRCHSETEAMIKSAVSRMFEEPDLIGDCSRPYCLPTVRGKHQDLKSITPETLSRLLADEFSKDIEEFHIVDCRYPYEYEGGHIQNAMNIFTKEDVIEKYLKSPLAVKDPSKRLVLIFHCEFSSERGPGLFRFLRRQDRESNKDCYPFLHYPEIYLLEGGYKNFFETYSHLCEPKTYKTMFDKNHSEDLRKFRAKCKSWSDDKGHTRTGVRNLKF